MVNPFYVLVDLAICVLAIRSMGLLRAGSPWATAAWAFAFVYGAAEAIAYSQPLVHRPAGQVGYGALVLVAVAFIVSGIRNEPQGDPWWWPRRTVRRTPRPRRP